jgi:hypothetical protein
MGEWLPIETAPRDGTSILLCYADNEQIVASFGGADDCPMWLADTAGIFDKPGLFTHWMPLPAPPA